MQIPFAAYADDCTVTGEMGLEADRLSDFLAATGRVLVSTAPHSRRSTTGAWSTPSPWRSGWPTCASSPPRARAASPSGACGPASRRSGSASVHTPWWGISTPRRPSTRSAPPTGGRSCPSPRRSSSTRWLARWSGTMPTPCSSTAKSKIERLRACARRRTSSLSDGTRRITTPGRRRGLART